MEVLQLTQFSNYLKPRPRDFHKGNAGHVLIVGGNYGYSGAARLAAEAALRVGAGLVSVATRKEHAMLLNVTFPELMSHSVETANELMPLIKKADVIIVGPGLGKTDWSVELLNAVFTSEKNLVVDADGLNLLAENKMKKSNWILTPHPGEASRLLRISSEEVQNDRVSAVTTLQHQYGGICILKGAGTLISSTNKLSICEAGNPGMATAGMGDVLSGVLGGLLAQGIPQEDAAKLGVLVHALAGDLAAKQGERGMIASDLIKCLKKVINHM